MGENWYTFEAMGQHLQGKKWNSLLLGTSLALSLFLGVPLYSDSPNKHQITYLAQVGQLERAIDLYSAYASHLGKHDFEVLQQLAFILLEEGAKGPNKETQLLSIFGSSIANVSASMDILEAGIKSEHAETQVASIQFLGRMQDDRSDDLLIKAMSSNFFYARMEAAQQLAIRKHKASVGQIESLMYRLPPEARFFFPQFFALIGTSDAVAILRHLMEDRYASVRVEAFLAAARFGRDDLLPSIRSSLTHLNVAEQEACAYAIGILKDSKSVKKLKELFNHAEEGVQIAAARSLYLLGDDKAKGFLIKKGQEGSLFAIIALSDVPESCDALAALTKHPDLSIRINATISLIKHRDPRSKRALLEILLRDDQDMGLVPHLSLGKTIIAFKPIYSAAQQTGAPYDVQSVTATIRSQLIGDAANLPEADFLSLAKVLFASKQGDLIPSLIARLETLQTPAAIALLKQLSAEAGYPLLRTYANLALYRIGEEGPYAAYLTDWIERNKRTQMIQFQPLVPMDKRLDHSAYELAPEDSSRLLIEIFESLAQKQQQRSVDLLLDAIQTGNGKNRYVLAGLLLRTLQ